LHYFIFSQISKKVSFARGSDTSYLCRLLNNLSDCVVIIAATPNEALKRALLWRYLADILLMNAHQLLLVHYEILVTQPVSVLKRILQQIPNAPPLYKTHKITASMVRQKREVLDEADLQAIGDICGESAVALGYML
jgi:hypothetical protein